MLTLMTLLPLGLAARAHPSDFRTLTIDLIYGRQGLETIDAAVVEATGPSYEPFPSVEVRQSIGEVVLGALGLSASGATIDAELSERYHEVGFTVSFAAPRPGQGAPLEFDTAQLQTIATDTNLDRLKLSVCAIDSILFSQLVIDSSRPGREPDDSTSERDYCQIWEVDVEESPVSFIVSSPILPITGFRPLPVLAAGLALLTMGCVILRQHRRSRSP